MIEQKVHAFCPSCGAEDYYYFEVSAKNVAAHPSKALKCTSCCRESIYWASFSNMFDILYRMSRRITELEKKV